MTVHVKLQAIAGNGDILDHIVIDAPSIEEVVGIVEDEGGIVLLAREATPAEIDEAIEGE